MSNIHTMNQSQGEKLRSSDNNTQLEKPFSRFISLREIHAALHATTESMSHSFNIRPNTVTSVIIRSPYYMKIIRGTLGEFIEFLRNFRNSSPCGFLHEQEIRVNNILLSPENCKKQEGYAGCGHPERNGVILALSIAEALLAKKYPDMKSTSQDGNPVYYAIMELDTKALKDTSSGNIKRNPDGSIPIVSHLSTTQKLTGETIERMCHVLADDLYRAYTHE